MTDAFVPERADIPEGWTEQDKRNARALGPRARYLLAQGDLGMARHCLSQAFEECSDIIDSANRATALAEIGQGYALVAAAGENAEITRAALAGPFEPQDGAFA